MLRITPIHAFSDNFIWLLQGDDPSHGVVVDPGDARPVLEHFQQQGIQLDAILVTHKHADHVGGIRQLLEQFPEAVVYGPAGEPVPTLQHRLKDGDRIQPPGLGTEFEVIDVPGHTEGHIAYYTEQNVEQPVLFCGDTLFSVGCGRIFSGTHDQLHDALMRFRALPDNTLAYCAHEYTLDNIGFAKWVEPDNADLLAREAEAHAQLERDQETVPSTLATEKATNPFLRIVEPAVIAAVEKHAGRPMQDSRDTFRNLRDWKDREYD
jgi:hydroxyacylglutathione hydrolase